MSEQPEVTVEELQKQLEEKDALVSDLQQQFNAVKGKADQLLDETKKAKAKAREEEEAKLVAEKEKAAKEGDYQQLFQSSEKERETLQKQLQELNGRVSTEKVSTTALKIASELADGANAELLSEFVSRRLKYTDEGLKVLDQTGNLTVSSVDDLKREFESNEKYKALIRGNKSSGGGAAGAGSSAPGAGKIERSKFNEMNHSQKMDFMKDGGIIIDN